MRLDVNEIRMTSRVFKVGLTEHDRHEYVREKTGVVFVYSMV